MNKPVRPNMAITMFTRNHQVGVSLVIVMIFLVILSGLAITAMQGSTFSARIAGNESDRTLAFQAAEAALKDAENDIRSQLSSGAACPVASTTCRADPLEKGNGFDTACPNGRCTPNAASPVWETATNWTNAVPANNTANSNGSVRYGFYTGAGALPVVAQQPRYLIEYFPKYEATVYRVTAMGYGASASTRAMLQVSVKAK
jgi:type IV pilus assembly protein PilX